jgi:hypothetical protein
LKLETENLELRVAAGVSEEEALKRGMEAIRKLGGAIFGHHSYGRVFIGCNGAESYYAGRGFRGSLRL